MNQIRRNPSKCVQKAKDNKDKLVALFQNIVDTMTFDEYVERFVKKESSIGKSILYFYCLPKTALHRDFRNKFLSSSIITNDIDYEKELLNKLIENTSSAKYNELTKQEFFQDETRDQMYKSFKKINAGWEKLIYVWIAYDFIQKGKPNIKKWAYVEIISQEKTPVRFAFFDN